MYELYRFICEQLTGFLFFEIFKYFRPQKNHLVPEIRAPGNRVRLIMHGTGREEALK